MADLEKQPYGYEQHRLSDSPVRGEGELDQVDETADEHKALHRDLSARQVSMIAIGGAIGTGLIIGTYVSSPCANTRAHD
jgi:amino acid transporter